MLLLLGLDLLDLLFRFVSFWGSFIGWLYYYGAKGIGI